MAKNKSPNAAGLNEQQLQSNFGDMHAPLSASEALIDADRCYFCYDAPCTTACPTGIDIPGFIQKIRSNNITGSAHTILSENIMGGMCARVCPTEVLCEEACVRHTHEDKPVNIGLLQRYATDPVINSNTQLFSRADESGKQVAVVGAGPAGLSCAHRLAMLGHDVVLFEDKEKMGGLNEYGIAAYKTTDDFAQREVDYILGIGGIECREGALGQQLTLAQLRRDFDAVFLSVGLNGVNTLGMEHEDLAGVVDAVDYIAKLRQTTNLSDLPVGNDIVVIGGGMTAIDVAVQSKKLGAENVTIAYRRGPEQMNASQYEQQFAQTNGVVIRHWLSPGKLMHAANKITGIEFHRTSVDKNGALAISDRTLAISADVVFKAIGQKLVYSKLGDVADQITIKHDRIQVNEHRQTSLNDVWAGGDCVYGGEDLTVSAVQDGKVAAQSIDEYLR